MGDKQYKEALRRKRTAAATLTEQEVARIKKLFAEGYSPRGIAEAYQVGVETVRRIRRGDSWGWVKPEGSREATAEAAAELRLAPAIEARIAEEARATGERMRALGLVVDSNQKAGTLAETLAREAQPTEAEQAALAKLQQLEQARTKPDREIEEFIKGTGESAPDPVGLNDGAKKYY